MLQLVAIFCVLRPDEMKQTCNRTFAPLRKRALKKTALTKMKITFFLGQSLKIPLSHADDTP